MTEAQPSVDNLIAEAVARQGGYEQVDTNHRWESVARAVGFKKSDATRIRERYEDLLRQTAEAEEEEEEEGDKDFEVEDILDSRIIDGKTEYLVQWKDAEGDDEEGQTWEPLSHLEGAQELLQRFEARRRATLPQEQPPISVFAPAAACKRRRDTVESNAVATQSSQWLQVLKIKKPESTDLSFLVACADGSQTVVSNTLLRAEAPLLLVDFYQARVRFYG